MADIKGKNRKSESTGENRRSIPILTPGIGTRIKRVSEMLGGNAAAGRIAFKSDIQIGRYIREESAPSIDVIVALAKAAGVSIGWLATGEGPMRPDEEEVAAQRPGEISPELTKKIIDSMTKEGAIKKEWAVPINYFVRIYNDIVDPDAPQEVIESTVLHFLLDTLQEQFANTQAALEQPIADDKHRKALESLLDYLAGKIEVIHERLERANQPA